MEENKTNVMEQPSVEQLKAWLDKATYDNRVLTARYQEIANILNVLPWLFKVMENKYDFEEEFVEKCKDTIQKVLQVNVEDAKEIEK